MFGHLKAEDFTNLIDGTPLSERQRSHLASCPRCNETAAATQKIRAYATAMEFAEDEYIPEPDWTDFRGDVRNALLSRSVQRTHASRGWFAGMSWRPIAAWSVSLALVCVVSVGVVLWNPSSVEQTTDSLAIPETADATTMTAIAGMGRTDVFDDVLRLNDDEAKRLTQMLDDLTNQGTTTQ